MSEPAVAPTEIVFFVPGLARPAGSKRAFAIPGKDGAKPRAIITDTVDTKGAGKDWRVSVQGHAREAYQGPPLAGPLTVEVVFNLPRPKAHFRTNGELKPGAPFWHSNKPDATKLMRALEDALKGILWNDDAQIADQTVKKQYALHLGASVVVRPLV